jgi:integrase
MVEHVVPKRKDQTAKFYRDILERIVKPNFGTTKIDKLTRQQVGKLHSSLADTPFQANRVLAAVGSMYSFAGRAGVVAEGTNPARGIERFKEDRRERFLTSEELERLGGAIREAETVGAPWVINESGLNAKHLARSDKRFTKINPFAAAALRLLLFTGCRLREILNLRWSTLIWKEACCSCPIARR